MSFDSGKSDLAAMGRLAQNIRRLADVPSQAARVAAEKIKLYIREQFTNGLDPYGKKWKALKASTLRMPRVGGVLVRTGKGAGSFEAKARRGAGIEITMEDYLGFHQTGFAHAGGRVPAREPLPSRGLPDTWARAIADALDDAFKRRLT